MSTLYPETGSRAPPCMEVVPEFPEPNLRWAAAARLRYQPGAAMRQRAFDFPATRKQTAITRGNATTAAVSHSTAATARVWTAAQANHKSAGAALERKKRYGAKSSANRPRA